MGSRSRERVTEMMTLAFPETVATDTLTEVTVGTWYSLFGSWLHSDDFPLRERVSAASRFLASALAPPGATIPDEGENPA